MFLDNLYIRFSNAVQTFSLKHPNFVTRKILTMFYDAECVTYTLIGAQEFLLRRENLLGKNFSALGKVILGGYDEVSKGILEPQERGSYLGRFRLIEDRFSEYFLLFLSDKAAGGGDTFEQTYDLVWDLLLEPAIARTELPESKAEIADFIDLAYGLGNPPPAKEVTEPLRRLVIRYILWVVLDVKITKEQEDRILNLVFGSKPSESMILSRARPFAPHSVPQAVTDGEAMFFDLVDKSSVMEGFDAANKNNLDRQQFVALVVQFLGFAGIVGSDNLATSIMTRTPADVAVDLDDAGAVELMVLETARRWSPVNNINIIAREPTTVNINGKSHTFPVGTVLALNLGIANLDPAEFPKPKTFDPHRANLCPAILSFGSVGEKGHRICPGRGIALSFANQLLVAWRKKVAAEAAA